MSSSNNFEVGDAVWVRMGSSFWWPAKIVPKDEKVLIAQRQNNYTVRYFGTYTYSEYSVAELGELEKYVPGAHHEYPLCSNKKDFKEAIAQATDYVHKNAK